MERTTINNELARFVLDDESNLADFREHILTGESPIKHIVYSAYYVLDRLDEFWDMVDKIKG